MGMNTEQRIAAYRKRLDEYAGDSSHPKYQERVTTMFERLKHLREYDKASIMTFDNATATIVYEWEIETVTIGTVQKITVMLMMHHRRTGDVTQVTREYYQIDQEEQNEHRNIA